MATIALTGTLTVTLEALQKVAESLSTPQDKPSITRVESYADGTDDEQINLLYHDRVTVNNAVVSRDLFGGGLAAELVDSPDLNFAKIRAIMLYNRSSVSGEYVKVFGGALGIADFGEETLHPGGTIIKSAPVDGFAVTAGSDVVQLDTTESGANVDVDMIILGTTN